MRRWTRDDAHENAATGAGAAAEEENILIVDDEHGVRERLKRVAAAVMPRARCEMAGSLVEARDRLARGKFKLALIDVNLPDGSGLDLLPWMRAHAGEVEAVVVSNLGDDATVLRAIRGGAVGYLLKNGSDIELELSLASMARGGAPIDPVIAHRILKLMAARRPAAPAPNAAAEPIPLSKRETDVLQMVAEGCSNREIAQHLSLTVNTIECHAKSIYRKLAVRSRAHAILRAREQGLLAP